MAIFKPVILLSALLLLLRASGWAQSRTGSAPASTRQQVTVSVTLPTVVAQLSDYAQTLFSHNKGKLRKLTSNSPSRTSNPVVEFTVELPKGWGARKRAADPEKK